MGILEDGALAARDLSRETEQWCGRGAKDVFFVSVECQANAGELFPVRFGWPDAMREVVEVDDWWPGDDHCYFRVRASDGGLYILRHNEPLDSWEVIFFESHAAPASAAQGARLN